MSATAEMIERFRRMIHEPTDDTYSDELLKEYVEKYPLLDSNGREVGEDEWEPVYDLHLAAADVWEEKVALYMEDFTFTADGATYRLSERIENMMARVRYHRANRTPKSVTVHKWPKESGDLAWIGNLPEQGP